MTKNLGSWNPNVFSAQGLFSTTETFDKINFEISRLSSLSQSSVHWSNKSNSLSGGWSPGQKESKWPCFYAMWNEMHKSITNAFSFMSEPGQLVKNIKRACQLGHPRPKTSHFEIASAWFLVRMWFKLESVKSWVWKRIKLWFNRTFLIVHFLPI